jgi:hypothetical protein
MTQASSASTTSRRRLLGQAAITGTAWCAGLTPAALAAVEDPHPEWKRQASALLDRINAGDLDDATVDTLSDELDELRDLIGETPARTREGVIAQLSVELRFLEQEGQSPDELRQAVLLRNAIGTLERLAREG